MVPTVLDAFTSEAPMAASLRAFVAMPGSLANAAEMASVSYSATSSTTESCAVASWSQAIHVLSVWRTRQP